MPVVNPGAINTNPGEIGGGETQGGAQADLSAVVGGTDLQLLNPLNGDMKQDDTLPWLVAVLLDGAGKPVNIGGCTVRFHMGPEGGSAVLLADAENLQNDDGSDGSLGQVRYKWQDGDTDAVGVQWIEFVVYDSTNNRLSFPNDGYGTLRIRRWLGED